MRHIILFYIIWNQGNKRWQYCRNFKERYLVQILYSLPWAPWYLLLKALYQNFCDANQRLMCETVVCIAHMFLCRRTYFLKTNYPFYHILQYLLPFKDRGSGVRRGMWNQTHIQIITSIEAPSSSSRICMCPSACPIYCCPLQPTLVPTGLTQVVFCIMLSLIFADGLSLSEQDSNPAAAFILLSVKHFILLKEKEMNFSPLFIICSYTYILYKDIQESKKRHLTK